MTVYALEIGSVDLPELSFRIRCSKGTYVRSIVHEIGRDLGCGAHLRRLRRTRQGPFGLDAALTWEEMTGERGVESIRSKMVAPSKALEFLPPSRVVMPLRRLRNGALLEEVEAPGPESTVRIVVEGRTAGMARRTAEGLRVVYVFPPPARAPRRRAS